MTLKEKVMQMNPECVCEHSDGGVKGCPLNYEYLNSKNDVTNCGNRNCEECWNQEHVENPVETVDKSELTIEDKRNAIEKYCEKHTAIDGCCNTECKLFQDISVNCHIINETDAQVEYKYNLIFGEPEDTTAIATDIYVGSKYEAALNYLFKKSVEESDEKDILITLQTALNYAHKKGKV